MVVVIVVVGRCLTHGVTSAVLPLARLVNKLIS